MTVTELTARNAAVDVRVIRELLQQLERSSHTIDVLADAAGTLEVLRKILDWSARAVSELEGR